MQRVSHSIEDGAKELSAEETIEQITEETSSFVDSASSKESDATTLVKDGTVDKGVDPGATSPSRILVVKKSTPKKYIEDEARAVGRVRWEIVSSFHSHLVITPLLILRSGKHTSKLAGHM
jgi:hypothetical protein